MSKQIRIFKLWWKMRHTNMPWGAAAFVIELQDFSRRDD